MKNIGQQKYKCNTKIICYIHTFVYKKKDIVVKTLIFVKKEQVERLGGSGQGRGRDWPGWMRRT